ncbi:sterile alpha motif domain-containing protein 3-like isoform X2 [Drosophila tropicalis]|uniref:sterile alpha motif domain-containing protein 3-like isoform X2 n=1 Tax=Drosophila tropicalis TaxID=46794 RepID=UPI0035ABBD18
MYTCRPMDNELFRVETQQQPQQHQQHPSDEVKKVIDLLISWNLKQLCQKFQEEEINEEALRCLNAAEIRELIPKVGPRAIFRSQLEKWKSQGPTKVISSTSLFNLSPVIKEEFEDTDTEAILSETEVEEMEEDDPRDLSDTETDWQQLNIEDILRKSTEGQQAKHFYEKNNYLDGHSKRFCVQAISNAIIDQNIQMPPDGFLKLAQQLIEIFPTEHLDTYYVPRKGTANPRGMLHNCYFNTKRRLKHQLEQAKKMKLKC